MTLRSRPRQQLAQARSDAICLTEARLDVVKLTLRAAARRVPRQHRSSARFAALAQ